MIAEGYNMVVQCDFHPYPYVCRSDFNGKSSADVWMQAKAEGWRLSRATGLARCGTCVAAGRNEVVVWPDNSASAHMEK